MLGIFGLGALSDTTTGAEPTDWSPARTTPRPAQVREAKTNLMKLNGVCMRVDEGVAIMLNRDGAKYCYIED